MTSDKARTQVAQARFDYEVARQQRQIAQLERDQVRVQPRRQRQLAGGAAVARSGR